jgi:hypothetical protein
MTGGLPPYKSTDRLEQGNTGVLVRKRIDERPVLFIKPCRFYLVVRG